MAHEPAVADAPEHAAHSPVGEGDDLPSHGALPEEPRSPAWLPLLGIALLAGTLIWWLSTPNAAEEARMAAEAAASASASAASASASASGAESAGLAPEPALTAIPAPPPPGPQPKMPRLPPGMQPAPGADLNPRFKAPH
jgi:hypothetical protein